MNLQTSLNIFKNIIPYFIGHKITLLVLHPESKMKFVYMMIFTLQGVYAGNSLRKSSIYQDQQRRKLEDCFNKNENDLGDDYDVFFKREAEMNHQNLIHIEHEIDD